MSVKGLKRRPSGLFYYRKGIPERLRPYYNGLREINLSLKTHDEDIAIKEVQKLTAHYENEFKTIATSGERDRAVTLLKKYELEPVPLEDQPIYQDTTDFRAEGSPYYNLLEDLAFKHDKGGYYAEPEPHEQRSLDILNGNESLSLTEVKDLAAKEFSTKRKLGENKRNFRLFIENMPTEILGSIKRKNVQKAIYKLLDSGLKTASVKKPLGHVRKRVRQAISLYELEIKNPFDDVIIPNMGEDEEKRIPFPTEILKAIKLSVQTKKNTTTVQIMGLLSDSGGRIGEIGGLTLDNIKLEHATPHLNIVQQPNRRLKNNNSERVIPLVGLSLEIAKDIVANAREDQVYAFPEYNKDDIYNGSNCPSAVNKMIKSMGGDEYTSHSFRHALRDRLLDASTPAYEVEQLTGWSDAKMINHYGKSKGLNILHKALAHMVEYEETEAAKNN